MTTLPYSRQSVRWQISGTWFMGARLILADSVILMVELFMTISTTISTIGGRYAGLMLQNSMSIMVSVCFLCLL